MGFFDAIKAAVKEFKKPRPEFDPSVFLKCTRSKNLLETRQIRWNKHANSFSRKNIFESP